MQRPTLLLDKSIEGMGNILQDLGWNVVRVKEALGPGAKDDAVVRLAREKDYIIVSPDRRLVRRCKAIGIRVFEVGLEVLAKKVHQDLLNELG